MTMLRHLALHKRQVWWLIAVRLRSCCTSWWSDQVTTNRGTKYVLSREDVWYESKLFAIVNLLKVSSGLQCTCAMHLAQDIRPVQSKVCHRCFRAQQYPWCLLHWIHNVMLTLQWTACLRSPSFCQLFLFSYQTYLHSTTSHCTLHCKCVHVASAVFHNQYSYPVWGHSVKHTCPQG